MISSQSNAPRSEFPRVVTDPQGYGTIERVDFITSSGNVY